MQKTHNVIKQELEEQLWDNAWERLVQLQNVAQEIGTVIEQEEHYPQELITYLEEYCELDYQAGIRMRDTLVGMQYVDKMMAKIECIRKGLESCEIEVHIAFLPYKYSMWDSLESIWRAASVDPRCECKVVPIPYYDKVKDGSKEWHYEGEAFAKEIPITDYRTYDLEKEKPDIVYIHNPYDNGNKVTSVDPTFYMEKIKARGAILVYVPYYIAGYCEKYENMTASCLHKATLYSDYIVVQSEELKQAYLFCGVAPERLLVTGSPKIDNIIQMSENRPFIPEEWEQKCAGRKVILLNSSLTTYLNQQEWLSKLEEISEKILENEGLALLWRPHPLLLQTIKNQNERDVEQYQRIYKKIAEAENGIVDTSEDFRAAMYLSDGMISDYSSLVLQYTFTGKPTLLLTGSSANRKYHVFCDYFSNYFWSDGVDLDTFIDILENDRDVKKQERIERVEKSVVNADGRCGIHTHQAVMDRCCNGGNDGED